MDSIKTHVISDMMYSCDGGQKLSETIALLRQGDIVIIDYKATDFDTRQRSLDSMKGALLASGGLFKELHKTTFMFAPNLRSNFPIEQLVFDMGFTEVQEFLITKGIDNMKHGITVSLDLSKVSTISRKRIFDVFYGASLFLKKAHKIDGKDFNSVTFFEYRRNEQGALCKTLQLYL